MGVREGLRVDPRHRALAIDIAFSALNGTFDGYYLFCITEVGKFHSSPLFRNLLRKFTIVEFVALTCLFTLLGCYFYGDDNLGRPLNDGPICSPREFRPLRIPLVHVQG